MTITASSTFTVASGSALSASVSSSVLAAVTSPSGRGRLVHPQLGTYDYANTPDEVEGIDATGLVRPLWIHSVTVGGGVDALWPGHIRDVTVVERWRNGDVGSTLALFRALWQMFSTTPTDPVGTWVVWSPNYLSAVQYRVLLVDVRAGGGQVLDLRLLRKGYAPQPVELQMRLVSAV